MLLVSHDAQAAATIRDRSDEWADDQLGAGKDGNEACLQCHAAIAATR